MKLLCPVSIDTQQQRRSSIGRLFEPLRQFLVARSYSAHPFPSARVVECLGSGEDFLGPLSTLIGKRQKPCAGPQPRSWGWWAGHHECAACRLDIRLTSVTPFDAPHRRRSKISRDPQKKGGAAGSLAALRQRGTPAPRVRGGPWRRSHARDVLPRAKVPTTELASWLRNNAKVTAAAPGNACPTLIGVQNARPVAIRYFAHFGICSVHHRQRPNRRRWLRDRVALPPASRNGSDNRNPTFHMHERLFGLPPRAGKSARISGVVCGASSRKPERER
jgi:hypothetical protein